MEFNNQKGSHQGRTSRQAADFYLPRCRLEILKTNVNYAGLDLFNHLPNELKLKKGDRNFKVVLKKFLVQGEFYTIQEFKEYSSEGENS